MGQSRYKKPLGKHKTKRQSQIYHLIQGNNKIPVLLSGNSEQKGSSFESKCKTVNCQVTQVSTAPWSGN